MPETLHYVDLFLWSDEMCQDAFSNADYVEMSESGSEICTYGVVSLICISYMLLFLQVFLMAKLSIFDCEP